MSRPPYPTPCPAGCRDECPCYGPTAVCLHGHWGPALGRKDAAEGYLGLPVAVWRVTPGDCARCGAGPAVRRR